MILGRQLSTKPENILRSIETTLTKPVIYHKIERGGFGKCGQDPINYYIWLDDELPDDAFEINLIHELLHLTQMHRDLPDARAINDNALGENDFACSINSAILDLEVENKLKEVYSFDTRDFSQKRLEQIQNIRKGGFKNFANNDFLQKHSALKLALYAYVAPPDLSNKMYDCFAKRYPKVVSMARKIQSIVMSNDHIYTDSVFKTMKSIIEFLNIGDHIKICYKNKHYLYHCERKEWVSKI